MTTRNQHMARFHNHLRVLNQAPDFTALDVDGREVRLSDLQGKKIVVLEFGSIT